MKSKNTIIKNNKNYFKSKVLSRNIITDWIQGIRNLLGMELKSYTNLINKTSKELIKEMPEMIWYRVDIEEFNNGGFMIAVYGEEK